MDRKPEEIARRWAELHGPRDQSRRHFLELLVGGGIAIASGASLLMLRKAFRESRYCMVNVDGENYVVIEGNDKFFRYDPRVAEEGDGYIRMRQREMGGSNGPTTLDGVTKEINGGHPKAGMTSLVPVAVIRQEDWPDLYERIRRTSEL